MRQGSDNSFQESLLGMVTLEQKRNLYASIGYSKDDEESAVILPKEVWSEQRPFSSLPN